MRSLWLVLALVAAPAARAQSADSLTLIIAWPAVSDANGAATAYSDTISSTRAATWLLAHTTTATADTVRLARPVPGDSVSVLACVRAIRRGLASAPGCVRWSYRAPDRPPVAPTPGIDSATAVAPTPAPAPAPSPTATTDPALFPGAAPRSPHFRHATFAYTDFYYSYYADATRPALASRYDAIMSGDRSQWRAVDSAIAWAPYRLHWTVLQPTASNHDYAALLAWYAAHPAFALEAAFLHQPGTVADSAHRMTATIWGSARWLYNPADSGVRVYYREQLAQLQAQGASGVFYDEMDHGNTARAWPSLEGDSAWYQHAEVARLAAEHAAFPALAIRVNTASYSTPFDSALIVAAGAGHLEMTNDPTSGTESYFWTWIDHLTAAGASSIEYVSTRSWVDKLPTGYGAGNEVSARARQKMSEYEAYLAVRDTARRVIWNHDNAWSEDPAPHWLHAFEADIGQPLAPRRVLTSGTDATGQSYRVWARDYSRALVLVRPISGWPSAPRFDDSTAVAVVLPAPMRVLRSDGVLSDTTSTVRLRAAEGAILIP